jgi:hypothetical protein
VRVGFVKTVIDNKVVFSLFTPKPTLGTISMFLIYSPLINLSTFYSHLSIGFVSTKTPFISFFKFRFFTIYPYLHLLHARLLSGAFLCVYFCEFLVLNCKVLFFVSERALTMKYVLVTGGVVSGLGKGVTASSIGLLLKACGLRVTSIKIGIFCSFNNVFLIEIVPALCWFSI